MLQWFNGHTTLRWAYRTNADSWDKSISCFASASWCPIWLDGGLEKTGASNGCVMVSQKDSDLHGTFLLYLSSS